MKIAAIKTTWMSVGFALALLVSAPTWADDTELLLVTPGTNENPFNANILLMLDSSGSMRTEEETNKPYD
ncbi:MAG: hypothetical protein OEM99_11830, partial [Gammaproteobacteria bacterium]|nr:hypothetical protein [Gammaproteobacteria bacterium]